MFMEIVSEGYSDNVTLDRDLKEAKAWVLGMSRRKEDQAERAASANVLRQNPSRVYLRNIKKASLSQESEGGGEGC